jgi:hypothetical protein
LPLSVGMEIAEGPVDGAFGASRFLENIEVMRQHPRIREDVEAAIPQASAYRLAGTELGLGELHRHRIGRTLRHRYYISQIAETLAAIQLRIIRPPAGGGRKTN